MKLRFTAMAMLVLTACNSSVVPIQHTTMIKVYEHPEYGAIRETDPRVREARAECEQRYYAEPIEIDGQQISDKRTLDSILYRKLFVELSNNSESYTSTADAEAAAMEFAESAPPYLLEIRRRQSLYGACFQQEKQFTPTRDGVVIDRQTGEELKYDAVRRGYVPIEPPVDEAAGQ